MSSSCSLTDLDPYIRRRIGRFHTFLDCLFDDRNRVPADVVEYAADVLAHDPEKHRVHAYRKELEQDERCEATNTGPDSEQPGGHVDDTKSTGDLGSTRTLLW